ncbi:CPBP family intramembrane metalloprotease [Stieleria sp. TO1_6]|uniref:CPBP family intramembrane glutamic endopeptidase n=1 Tax=Stieleria tagensis TaxID=2956795 RepID=UPI00209B8C67|nr:CPBP family intramembrane glutamic endopeptidase [Stieleria tagensis]MCO8125519.1 CPBP family intramembrane metalloprotease [Stieleria tagensis]
MPSETYFAIAFYAILVVVFSTIATGCVFWARWLWGLSKRNLCGDVSGELITRHANQTSTWRQADYFSLFLMMFGVMFLTVAILGGGEPRQPQADPTTGAETETSGDRLTETVAAPDDDQPAKPKPPLGTQVRNQFVATLAALLVALAYLQFNLNGGIRQAGLIPTGWDLRCGLIATIWILTPVLLINLVVSNLVKYEHAVTNFLAQQNSLGTFSFLMLSAAVLTPIVEEIQFRLLLQGGLQRIAEHPLEPSTVSNWHPSVAWPIYVTSLVFAALHSGQGAAPIPLFFLSIGLGFLYQRTGRIAPAIIVHSLLNGATLCMEFARVNAGIGP